MNLLRHSWTLTLALGCLIASFPGLVRAQDSSANQPAVVVALKDVTSELADVKFLVTEAGFADQANLVPMMAQGYLAGIDKTKPLGVSVWFEGQEARAVGMIPVTDIDAVLDQIAAFGTAVDEEGDFYFLQTPGAEIVVTVKDGYAFLSDSKDHLAELPGTPAELLSGVAKEQILAAKLFVQRIPVELRDMAVEQMRDGFESAMKEMDNGDLEDLQREANAMQMQQLIDLVQNSDQLEMGFGVEQSSKKLVFDMSFTGLEDSKIAKQSAAMEGKSSKFGKFLVDSAAFNSNGFGVLLEEDKQNMKTLLENVKKTAMQELETEGDMSDEEREVVVDLVDDVFDLLNSSIEDGFLDVGATLMTGEGSMNLAVGGNLADTAKYDSLVEKLTTLATQQQEVAIEAGKATVSGIEFDKMTVTLPEDVEDEVRQMFGDQIVLLMGRTESEAYFAAGTSPEETFETIMGNSNTNSEYPVVYNVRILPILEFASTNPEAAAMIDQLLSNFDSENDRISIYSKIIENGQQVRGEIDTDLLKLIGTAVQMQQRQMMQGGPGADF